MEGVDAILCLNMKEANERRRKMEQQLTELGLVVEWAEAVSKYSHPVLSKLAPLLENAGRVGCFFSHLMAIRKAKALGVHTILILEDDVVFAHDFVQHFSERFTNLPEEVVYVGQL